MVFPPGLTIFLGGFDRGGIDGAGRCCRYPSSVLAVCCPLPALSRLFRPHRTPPDGCGWLAPRGLGASGRAMILSTTACSVRKATTRIAPPQRGQSVGSTAHSSAHDGHRMRANPQRGLPQSRYRSTTSLPTAGSTRIPARSGFRTRLGSAQNDETSPGRVPSSPDAGDDRLPPWRERSLRKRANFTDE